MSLELKYTNVSYIYIYIYLHVQNVTIHLHVGSSMCMDSYMLDRSVRFCCGDFLLQLSNSKEYDSL